jgi:endo-1,4-beta-D-glucanase Y
MIRRISTALAVLVVLVVFAGAGWWIARAVDPRPTDATTRSKQVAAAQAAGRAFLDQQVQPDGQVIRRDEGGDVVSEGQAYAMLIAAGIGDQQRFRTVWSWTKDHLQRPDKLLSWRWANGTVTDVNSAADADLDAARALLLAGKRFSASDLAAAGKELGEAVLAHETATVGTTLLPPDQPPPPPGWGLAGTGRVLTAGTWVNAPPYVINPGYFSPRAERDLFAASSDQRWTELTRTQRIIGWQLIGTGLLPPDWARVDMIGGAVPTGPATGGDPQFGLDAARFPVRLAESCDRADRALAVALRPILNRVNDAPGIRRLDGTVAAPWQHPIALVAAAAADYADGDLDATSRHLDAAGAVLQKYPTYYGAAWFALGRIMLTTTLLGECPKDSSG